RQGIEQRRSRQTKHEPCLLFRTRCSLAARNREQGFVFSSVALSQSASLLLPATNDIGLAGVAHAMGNSLEAGSREPFHDVTNWQVVESSAPGFALQPLSVARHAPDILEQLQGFTRAEHEWQRVKADLAPVRLGHVDRKDELTTWTQDAVHLAQQGLVRFGRPAFIGSVRLGVLNRESRDDAVEVTVLP